MATRTVSVALVADVGRYQSAMVQAAASTKGVGAAAETTGAKAQRGFDLAGRGGLVLGAGLGAAALGIKSSITAASDLSETLNKSTVIFGENAAKVEAWSEDSARNFGLSKAAALEAAAGFGNMLQQLGYTGEEAVNASTDVVQLAADLGSFNNLETGDVLDRIGAAMRGEYDSLQLLIPNINAARVETEALTATGKDNKDALTAQEKAAAVLAIVNRDGAAAANDFAETSGGLANATKIAKAEFENLQAEIGQRFLPIAASAMGFVSDTALPALGSFADIVFDLASAFGDLPGPLQVATVAAVGWAVAGGRIMDALRPMGGVIGSVQGTWRSFGEALDYARVNGDGLGTTLRSVGDYAGGQLVGGLGRLARAIGPELGIAAAVAGIGWMVTSLTSMDEATDQAKAAQQDLASALEETNGVIDENVRQTAAKAAQDADLLDAADAMGISLSTVTDAVLGNAGAYDEAVRASEAYLQAVLDRSEGDPTTAEFQDAADAVRIFQNDLGVLAPTVKNTIGDQQQLADATKQTGGAATAVIDPIEAYKLELEAAAAAADEAKKQTDQFKLSLDILTGATVTTIEVESAFREAIASADGALENMNGTVLNGAGDLNTQSEAGRAAADVLLDVRNRGNDLIATMIQQGATSDDVRQRDAELRNSFINTAGQMGISRDAAERLADQILGIPSERETKITADTQQAAGAISGLQAQINEVARDRAATINLRATMPDLNGSASGTGRMGTFAEGGYTGPGGKYQPAGIVHAGEYVFTQEQVRRLGVDRLEAVANGDFLPGYAAGGFVRMGSVSQSRWDQLLAQGWRGRAGDSMEALYAPTGTTRVDLTASADTSGALSGLARQEAEIAGAISATAAAVQAAAAASASPGGGGSLAAGSGTISQLMNTIRAAFPRAKLNSGLRPGDPGYHGLGRAVDLGEQGFAGGTGRPYLADMAAWIYRTHGAATKELIYTGAYDRTPDLKNGRVLNYGASTNAAHRNHVHWAMANGGVIGEPVAGVGMWSGGSYSFGERGPETVLPGVRGREFSGAGAAAAPTVVMQPINLDGVAVEGRVVIDREGFARFVDGRIVQRDNARAVDWRSAQG